jgi:uncharacterized membrane protein
LNNANVDWLVAEAGKIQITENLEKVNELRSRIAFAQRETQELRSELKSLDSLCKKLKINSDKVYIQ